MPLEKSEPSYAPFHERRSTLAQTIPARMEVLVRCGGLPASGDGPPGQTLAGKILPEARFFDSRIYGERDPTTTTKRIDATQVVRG